MCALFTKDMLIRQVTTTTRPRQSKSQKARTLPSPAWKRLPSISGLGVDQKVGLVRGSGKIERNNNNNNNNNDKEFIRIAFGAASRLRHLDIINQLCRADAALVSSRPNLGRMLSDAIHLAARIARAIIVCRVASV